MTTQAFTREQLRAIQADIQAALNTVADKHGIDLSTGSLSYTATDFKTSVTGAIRNTARNQVLPASHKWTIGWNRHAVRYGLNPADLGREFNLAGLGRVQIVGLSTHGRDPIVVKLLDRPTDKFSLINELTVQHALKTAA